MFVLAIKRGVLVTVQMFASRSAARAAFDAASGDVVELGLGRTVFATRRPGDVK